MKPQFSQKTMWLCFFGGLTFVMAAGLMLQLSANHGSSPRVIERVIDTADSPAIMHETVKPSPDPISDDAAAVPVLTGPDWDEVPSAVSPSDPNGVDKNSKGSSEDEAVEDPFA